MNTRRPHFIAGFSSACMEAGLSEDETKELWKKADAADMEKQAISSINPSVIWDAPRMKMPKMPFTSPAIPEWAKSKATSSVPSSRNQLFGYMSSSPTGARSGGVSRNHPAYGMKRLAEKARADQAEAASLLDPKNILTMDPHQAQQRVSRLRRSARQAEDDLIENYGRYSRQIGGAQRHIGKELDYLRGKRERFMGEAQRRLAARDAELGTFGGKIRGALGGQWMTNRAVRKAQDYNRQIEEMEAILRNLRGR